MNCMAYSLALGSPAEAGEVPVSGQEGLLHEIRGIGPAAQVRVRLREGGQHQ
jgi:hypothetical protein